MALLARFYQLQFLRAVELESQGKYDEALCICMALRLRPDLEVFRRAALNAFIAIIVNPRTHDAKEFARECLDFCQLFRDSNPDMDEEKQEEITRFEQSSRFILQQTREELLAEWTVIGGGGDEGDGGYEGDEAGKDDGAHKKEVADETDGNDGGNAETFRACSSEGEDKEHGEDRDNGKGFDADLYYFSD